MSRSFVFPVTEIIGDRFRLVPFESEEHAEAFCKESNDPKLWAHMTSGPFETKDQFVEDVLHRFIESDQRHQMYAVLTSRPHRDSPKVVAESRSEDLAGVAAYINASAEHSQVEIGFFVMLPQYQGTGLAFSVADIMCRHALNEPIKGGLGCRRVVWEANSENFKSQKLALKLGFKREGVLRWHRVFRNGKARGKIGNGRPLPNGAGDGDLGRDSVTFSRCWDD